ncbi:Putative histidine kinase containing cheY-homologous receiver domain [Klebsormidium nitens]|uniref:Putative histidine kinase containing cheY-homologous receiver domain n=1 Tax=Klebsormidium nitens TaxID=105231 RepID=A0A1Y1I5R0_KLENI|nr:Putative histidine kinase containing cheY-homologous receiver domain [Klebsormidium nitens]|eukprot:GAQ84739.1 Putative histidine kinase containing cheY-homologous receiver domain [Klebsormidium nitens]
MTSAGIGFTCVGPLQHDPFVCPAARRPSPVGFVMRPGPESEYDPQGAPKPSNEEFRVNVLRSYNILDTEPEPRYDRLTALASMIFHTTVSLITLTDSEITQWKSNTGFAGAPREVPRWLSFCQYVILPSVDPVLVVCDALKDGRFCKNPLVIGEPHIRFYAGAPLVTQGNFVLGSLCIIDFEPRDQFTAEEQEMLISLAQLVVLEIEKHTRALELQRLQVERFEEDKRGLLQAIDAFSEGLVLCDVSQKGQPIVFVNEGWETITGYSIQDVLGLHCGSLLEGPLTDIKAKQLIAAACQEGSSASVEILNYRKDGTPFWNWLRIRPVVFPKGTSFGGDGPADISSRYYFGICSDCTLRKEKELELEAIRLQELEAEASVRAKRSFVANISHEIRTPMNAILACSQLLTDMASLTDEQRELSQMIQGSGQQLLSLINDILDFSKMDAGKMELKASEFNLWGCLDFCMEMLVLKCENKGLYLSYNMDESVPDWIWADEVRLRQILTNLLSNSAKFTDEGGEVEVSVSAKRLRRQLSKEGFDGPLSPRGGAPSGTGFDESGDLPEYRITIAVRDTGIGIPVTFQKMLFEAFTQCDNSRTRRYEGTGLGLAISKDLAERMGGKMWVESEEGVGSTFFVTITARGSMQPSTGRSLSPQEILHRPSTAIVGKKALLVGTRGAFHRMVGSMLRAWGLDVSVATSVEELEALAGGRGVEVSVSEADASVEASTSGAGERVSANREGVSGNTEGVSTYGEGVSAKRQGVSANGWGGRLERMDVDQGRSFDLFVVDSPVAGRVFDTRKLEALMAESREAIELMHRACALGRGIPTVLLTSKNTRNVFQFDMEAMERVICVSQPVRINPFYTTLLQTLANESPAAPLTSPSALPANGTPPPHDVPLQIFVVEDNLVNQKVLHKVLKSLGYEDIRTACNGLEVLQLLKEHTADVVLMDVQMPEMDGLTATTRIKADFPEERQPMIIALTADVGNDIEKECREAGMISYLSKPVRKAQLERLLSKCMYFKQHPAQRRTLKWIDGL